MVFPGRRQLRERVAVPASTKTWETVPRRGASGRFRRGPRQAAPHRIALTAGRAAPSRRREALARPLRHPQPDGTVARRERNPRMSSGMTRPGRAPTSGEPEAAASREGDADSGRGGGAAGERAMRCAQGGAREGARGRGGCMTGARRKRGGRGAGRRRGRTSPSLRPLSPPKPRAGSPTPPSPPPRAPPHGCEQEPHWVDGWLVGGWQPRCQTLRFLPPRNTDHEDPDLLGLLGLLGQGLVRWPTSCWPSTSPVRGQTRQR